MAFKEQLNYKKKLSQWAAFFICGIATLSCTTINYVNYDILKPAEVRLSPNVSRLGYLARGSNDTLMQVSLYQGFLSKALEIDSTADSIPVIFYLSRLNSDSVSSLSWYEVNHLCKKMNVDALISMEQSKNIYHGSNIYNDQTWRLYEPSSKEIIDQWVNKDSMAFASTDEWGNIDFNNNKELRNEAIKYIGKLKGSEYASRIFNHWETIDRILVGNLNTHLNKGISFAQKDQWEDALKQFQIASLQSNNDISLWGLYNMSICYERLETFDKAHFALNLCLEKAKNTKNSLDVIQFLNQYKESLQKHEKDYLKLNE